MVSRLLRVITELELEAVKTELLMGATGNGVGRSPGEVEIAAELDRAIEEGEEVGRGLGGKARVGQLAMVLDVATALQQRDTTLLKQMQGTRLVNKYWTLFANSLLIYKLCIHGSRFW